MLSDVDEMDSSSTSLSTATSATPATASAAWSGVLMKVATRDLARCAHVGWESVAHRWYCHLRHLVLEGLVRWDWHHGGNAWCNARCRRCKGPCCVTVGCHERHLVAQRLLELCKLLGGCVDGCGVAVGRFRCLLTLHCS